MRLVRGTLGFRVRGLGQGLIESMAKEDATRATSEGEELVGGRVGQEITRQLFSGELIEWLVGVESADDPITVRPHLSVIVKMQSMSVPVACRIEPVPGSVFAPSAGGHQTVNPLLESLIRFLLIILQESVDLFHLRRQTGNVE